MKRLFLSLILMLASSTSFASTDDMTGSCQKLAWEVAKAIYQIENGGTTDFLTKTTETTKTLDGKTEWKIEIHIGSSPSIHFRNFLVTTLDSRHDQPAFDELCEVQNVVSSFPYENMN